MSGRAQFCIGCLTRNVNEDIPSVTDMYHSSAQQIDPSEHEILLLLSIVPVSYFPPQRLRTVEELARKGLINHGEKAWYPTSHGLLQVGQTLH